MIANAKAGGEIILHGGSYAAGLTLAANTIQNVTDMVFEGGASYDVTTNDANVGAGKSLAVNAFFLLAGQALTFDGSAETDGRFSFIGGQGDDVLIGGARGDDFDIGARGGNDAVSAGAGSDKINGLMEGDQVDGGEGFDTVRASTEIDPVFDFTATTLVNVESLVLAGSTFNLNDGNVAAGKTLDVTGAPELFDGSAETDGHFHIVQNGGGSTWLGGALRDTIDVSQAIGTQAASGGGNDLFIAGAALSDNFFFDGGEGSDTLSVAGDYLGGYQFQDNTIVNVEKLALAGGNSYFFTSADGNVGSGQVLTVDLSALGSGDLVAFDGGAETDGNFVFLGGAGSDQFRGGQNDDAFTGGRGEDVFNGDGGADRFIYRGIKDTTVAAPDFIAGFSHIEGDAIDLSAIDANGNAAGDGKFHFIGTAAFSHTAGELRFEKTGGNTFITGDVNGDAVADFQIELGGKIGLHAADFIL